MAGQKTLKSSTTGAPKFFMYNSPLKNKKDDRQPFMLKYTSEMTGMCKHEQKDEMLKNLFKQLVEFNNDTGE